jgi:hypothetical protein
MSDVIAMLNAGSSSFEVPLLVPLFALAPDGPAVLARGRGRARLLQHIARFVSGDGGGVNIMA